MFLVCGCKGRHFPRNGKDTDNLFLSKNEKNINTHYYIIYIGGENVFYRLGNEGKDKNGDRENRTMVATGKKLAGKATSFAHRGHVLFPPLQKIGLSLSIIIKIFHIANTLLFIFTAVDSVLTNITSVRDKKVA